MRKREAASDPREHRKKVEGRGGVDLDGLVDNVMAQQLGYHRLSKLGGVVGKGEGKDDEGT
jgi:hypothetical protein